MQMRGLWHGFKHVEGKNNATAFLSNHKRGGTFHVKHGKVLTAKQADFVNKELNTSNGMMSIKKIVTQNMVSRYRIRQCLSKGFNNRN